MLSKEVKRPLSKHLKNQAYTRHSEQRSKATAVEESHKIKPYSLRSFDDGTASVPAQDDGVANRTHVD